MAKSLFYRLFGAGKISEQMSAVLKSEGILLMDEGLKASVVYRDFHAPGKSMLYRRAGLVASIALTKTRLVALASSEPIINVPFTDQRIRELHCSVEGEKLTIAFDPALFHDDWSGTIEYRFRTPQAQGFLNLLKERID